MESSSAFLANGEQREGFHPAVGLSAIGASADVTPLVKVLPRPCRRRRAECRFSALRGVARRYR
jgi:hypothetical protein